MADQFAIVSERQKFKKTPAGEIPVDWDLVSFGDAFQFLPTANNSRADLKDVGDLGYIHYGDIHTKWRTTLRCDRVSLPHIDKAIVGRTVAKVRDGDLVIADASEDYDALGVAVEVRGVGSKDIVSGLHTLLLRDKGGYFADGFRGYLQYMPSVRRQLIEVATGVSVFGISRTNLSRVLIPRPPIVEQQKIAEILSTVDRVSSCTGQLIQRAEHLNSLLLGHLMSHGLRGEQRKNTSIGLLPMSWDIVPLGSVAQVERGKFQHRPRNDPRFFGGQIPFIQTGEVTAARGRLEAYSQTLNDKGLAISRLFPKGTVLMTIAANIGETAIVDFPVAFPDSIVGIMPGEKMDSRFLEYFLRTRKSHLNGLAPQSAQKNINLEILKPYSVPVPAIGEQSAIADALDWAFSREALEISALEKHEAMKAALMKNLLAGTIRTGRFG